MATVSGIDIESILGLTENIPSDTEVLFPYKKTKVKLVDGTDAELQVYPWGLGRFVEGQGVVANIIGDVARVGMGLDFEQTIENMDAASLLRVVNILMPHVRDLILITLKAKDTFEQKPENIRQFVDDLSIASAVQLLLIVLQQNWRHIKNVLGLTEIQKLNDAISARQSNS